MDATYSPLRKLVLIILCGLLTAAAAPAVTLSVSPTTVTFDKCTWYATLQLTSTISSPAYTVTAQSGTAPNWFTWSISGSTVNLQLTRTSTNDLTETLNVSDGTTTVPVTVKWSSNTSTCTPPVTTTGLLTVTATPPGSGANTMALSTTTTAAATGTLSLANGLGAALGYTVTSSETWLTANPSSGNLASGATSPVTVTADPTGLTQGVVYEAMLTVTPTTAGVAATTITVLFGVGATPTPTGTLTLNSTGKSSVTLTITYDGTGQSYQNVTTQSSAGSQSVNVTSITTTSGGKWLGAGGTSGISSSPTGPYAVSSGVWVGLVSDVVSTLGGGVYTGEITLTADDGSQAVIKVQLTIAGGTPDVTLSPTTYQFAAASGSSTTQNALFNATAATGVTLNTPYASSAHNWLSISSTPGTNMYTILATANPTNLPDGVYAGAIIVPSNGPSGAGSATIPVTLVVGAAASIKVTEHATTNEVTSLSYSYLIGSTAPSTQLDIVSAISGASGISFAVGVTTDNGGNWLSTNYTAGAATPYTLTVSVVPGTLSAGTYTGKVTITPATGTAISIPVTVTILGTPTVSASPATLNLAYQQGSTQPSGTVQVTGTNAGAVSFTVTTASSGGWLMVTPTSGTTPQTLTLKMSSGSLDPGTYAGRITIAGGGGVATVDVTLKVTAPVPTISHVVNAATGAAGPVVAPGEIVSLYAPENSSINVIGPATAVGTQLDADGKVATTLGGVQVLFSGYAAPLLYVSARQINAVVPYEWKNVSGGGNVQVKFLKQTSNTYPLTKASLSPGIFTMSGNGIGQAAALNEDWSVNGPDNPAEKGHVVMLWVTGEGETQPAGVTGKVTTVAATEPITPKPVAAVGVTIDGRPATVDFWGEAPGMVSGVMQLNVRIPSDTPTGIHPIVVSIGGVSSPPGVEISVK